MLEAQSQIKSERVELQVSLVSRKHLEPGMCQTRLALTAHAQVRSGEFFQSQ